MNLTILAAAVAAMATPGVQQRPLLPTSGPTTMDVAGVRLGQSAEEARRAIAAAGYRVTYSGTVYSFAQEVTRAVAEARSRGIPEVGPARTPIRIMADGPHGETMIIDFSQWPVGPLVTDVSLRVSQERQSEADFRQQAQAKYGKPSLRRSAAEDQWCSPGETKCDRMSQPELASISTLYLFPNNSLSLTAGQDVVRQRGRTFKAAVEQQVPPVKRSTF